MKTKLDEIKYKTLNEIQKVKEDYKKEIIANKSFGYIAIISITVLIAFVLIMDITKLNVFKKFSRKTIKSSSNNSINESKMADDDLIYKKVRNMNLEINKRMEKLKSLKN